MPLEERPRHKDFVHTQSLCRVAISFPPRATPASCIGSGFSPDRLTALQVATLNLDGSIKIKWIVGCKFSGVRA